MTVEWHEHYEPNPIDDKDVGLDAVLRKIRYDLTAAQGKLTEAMRMVALLDLEEGAGDRIRCPRCGVSCKGQNTLAEHMYHSHDGPEPEHWKRIEAMSEEIA